MEYVVAIDVGGTDIKSALIDRNLTTISQKVIPTPLSGNTQERILDSLTELVAEYSKIQKVSSVGISFPGIFDDKNGVCIWSENLILENFHIKDLLENRVQAPIIVKHDVRTAAIAELRNGAAKNTDNAIFMSLGTGIAAAIIMNGEICASNGYAGEIGHVNVNGKFACVCGKFGCLEAASSTLAISKAYASLSRTEGVSTEEIHSLVLQGDPIAMDVWRDAMSAIGRACEILVTLLAPEVIVLGGGLSNAKATLLEPVSQYLADSLSFQRRPRVELAHFGSKAGVIGCAIIAFELLSASER